MENNSIVSEVSEKKKFPSLFSSLPIEKNTKELYFTKIAVYYISL